MTFEEAKSIAKENIGARIARRDNDDFCVILRDGTYCPDTENITSPPVKEETNLITKYEIEIKSIRQELESEKKISQSNRKIIHGLRSKIEKLEEDYKLKIANLHSVISNIPETIWINAEKKVEEKRRRDALIKELMTMSIEEIKAFKARAIEQGCSAEEISIIDKKIYDKEKFGYTVTLPVVGTFNGQCDDPAREDQSFSPTKKPIFCTQCGGDGGATGNCPRCYGNGMEPEE